MEQVDVNRAQAPCRWLYRGAMGVIRPLLQGIFGLEVENARTLGWSGPAVLVIDHQGLLDFLLAAAAFPDREISYVGSERYFQNPRLGALLHKLGVISKRQFYPDAGAIKSIMRRIKEGGLVGVSSLRGRPLCAVCRGPLARVLAACAAS